MKFGQLIECNLRDIFLEKSYTKYDGETIPRFLWRKIKIEHISGSIFYSFTYLFLLFAKLRTIQIDWNQAADHLHLLQIKLFKKAKRGLELVSLPHFLHDFWKKNISFVIFFYLTKYAFTSWDIGQYVYCNSLLTTLWRNKLWD